MAARWAVRWRLAVREAELFSGTLPVGMRVRTCGLQGPLALLYWNFGLGLFLCGLGLVVWIWVGVEARGPVGSGGIDRCETQRLRSRLATTLSDCPSLDCGPRVLLRTLLQGRPSRTSQKDSFGTPYSGMFKNQY